MSIISTYATISKTETIAFLRSWLIFFWYCIPGPPWRTWERDNLPFSGRNNTRLTSLVYSRSSDSESALIFSYNFAKEWHKSALSDFLSRLHATVKCLCSYHSKAYPFPYVPEWMTAWDTQHSHVGSYPPIRDVKLSFFTYVCETNPY